VTYNRLAVGVAAALLLSACTSTKQFADLGFQPPSGDYSLVVMRPDVSVGSLTTGGMFEMREDWTDAARANLLAALKDQQAGRGGRTVIVERREDVGTDPARVADLERLHQAVGSAIALHKYLGATLPTKKDKFDWTLGEEAVALGRASGHDYALFLHAQDSFASTGRVALQVVGMLGCAVGACVVVGGGQQAAYASLVDLKTGDVVWFNALGSSVGDIRTAEGARKMVDRLLDRMKPGKKG
jgi:hypothetical protein